MAIRLGIVVVLGIVMEKPPNAEDDHNGNRRTARDEHD